MYVRWTNVDDNERRVEGKKKKENTDQLYVLAFFEWLFNRLSERENVTMKSV